MKRKKLILLLSKDETHVIEVSDRDFHSSKGIIKSSVLKKAKPGSLIETHLNKQFLVLKPIIVDILGKKSKRMAQVMLPKDIALLLAYTGISTGSLIVDAGSGSGYTAIFLAHYCKDGKIVTYEKRSDFARIARKNIELSGLKNIVLKEKDVREGIEEKNVDLVNLDMKDAEKVVKNAFDSLKPGGWLTVFSPYIEQVISVRRAIEKLNFTQIKTIENITREWRVSKHTLPEVSGVLHTGWLTFARKII